MQFHVNSTCLKGCLRNRRLASAKNRQGGIFDPALREIHPYWILAFAEITERGIFHTSPHNTAVGKSVTVIGDQNFRRIFSLTQINYRKVTSWLSWIKNSFVLRQQSCLKVIFDQVRSQRLDQTWIPTNPRRANDAQRRSDYFEIVC